VTRIGRFLPEPLRKLARTGRDVGRFSAAYRQNRNFKERYRESKTTAGYYALAVDAFGMLQKPPEILGLIEYLDQEKPKTICEIGTFKGGTTFLLSQALESVDTTIGVDVLFRNMTLMRYMKRPGQRLHFVRGSSYDPATVAEVEAELRGRQIDFLFIDGDHAYEGVSADFFAYRRFVRDGGLIAFHDIVSDYATRYGRKTTSATGGVPLFWSQVKELLWSREFIEDPEQDGYGIGLLRNRVEVAIDRSALRA
jgi:cephalosporin hydroxylase